jgi:hypothetical protein
MARTMRLRSGLPRLLPDHRGIEGRLYRESYRALIAEFGAPASDLDRLELARVAALSAQAQLAMRALLSGTQTRRVGKGRKPNARQIERLARRQGLADGSYVQALEKLRERVAAAQRRKPKTGAELLAQIRGTA